MGEIQQKANRTLIQKETIFLKNELFTFRIEAEVDKQIEELKEKNPERLEEIGRMGSKKQKEPEYDDKNKLVFEFTDASYILTEMLSRSSIRKYVDYLSEQNADNDDYNKNEVEDILAQEEYFRDKIRIDRDSSSHETTIVNEEKLIEDISAIIAYIMYLREMRMLVWEQFDEKHSASIEWKYNRLLEIENKALELNNRCFTKDFLDDNEDAVTYKFNNRIYTINQEQKAAFNMLISDMARNWFDGIEYIKADTKDTLDAFVEARFGDGKELRTFRIFKDELRQVKLDDIKYDLESNVSFMQLIYILNPDLGAFYWKGTKLTESKFASKVLQTLTRHDNANSLTEKIGTLEYRVAHFSDWKDPFTRNSEDIKNRPGIGIDLVRVCKKGILSCYFHAKKNKQKQAELAKRFEESIISISQHKLLRNRENGREFVVENEADYVWFKENYDDTMQIIYEFIGSMKSEQTYRDMYGRIFKNKDQFIEKILLNKECDFSSLQDMQSYLKKVSADSGFRYWISNVRG